MTNNKDGAKIALERKEVQTGGFIMIYTNSRNFRARAFLTLGSVLAAAGLSAGSAWAASAVSETVLYSFCQQTKCADGQFPAAGLVATNQGGLYGTTEEGGNADAGVAFLVTVTGGYGLLHVFQNSSMDGGYPIAPLFRDKSGNFFGTTTQGGASGNGTVFERSASGVYRLRHAFNGTDGSDPSAGVVADSAGNLYGTTFGGGANGSGAIFVLTPNGNLKTLYSFCSVTGCADGCGPEAGLIGDASGNLYGTTELCGANGFGVVFKIHADGTGYTVLHSFMGGSDGASPAASLSADASGTLYGTTFGTVFSETSKTSGTVFKIAPDGSNYAVLYNFCSLASCADGAGPDGSVILDAAGNLYGTTEQGGANVSAKYFAGGGGVVFSLTPSGTETVLYSFCSTTNANGVCLDGQVPLGNLAALGNGNLYGTTNFGGSMNAGTVYQLSGSGFVLPSAAAKS
jgi:uncharacterized repeat protein (TIGR03803 family)